MTQSPDHTVTGNTTQTQPENRAFYPALDGLRGVAFLMVFFQHYLFAEWGWTGVNLFFVLSGFLITGILYDTRNHPHRVRNFYIRRTLRIFPLYYGIMLLILILYPVMNWKIDWLWLVWPAYLGNVIPFLGPYLRDSNLQRIAWFQVAGHNGNFYTTLFLGHFWSLCVEEQFYLVWPWLVFWIHDRRKLLFICLAMFPICLIARIAGQHTLPLWMLEHPVLHQGTPFCIDALFLGGALALIFRGPNAARLLRFARIAFPICFIAIAAAAILTPYGHILSDDYHYPTSIWTYGISTINILAAVILLTALQPKTVLYRIFHIKPLRWLGRISYGAYVLHDVPHLIYSFIAQSISPTHEDLLTIPIALIATILLAWLSFRFFETPFLNLKERLTFRYPEVSTSGLIGLPKKEGL